MTADRVEGIIGLTVIALAFLAVAAAIWADARAERAHQRWLEAWQAWIQGGMKGPRP